MNAILNMIRLHLQLTFQSTPLLIQFFVVPVILMVVLGLAVNEDNAGNATIPVDVVDQDGTVWSTQLIDTLRLTSIDDESFVFCIYGASDIPDACGLGSNDTFEAVGTERLEEVDTAATLIIPAGFGAALENGEAIALEYRSDNDLNVPTLVRTQIESALVQLSSSIAIANTATNAAQIYFEGYPDAAAEQAAFVNLQTEAQTELQTPAVIVEQESSGEEVVIGIGARQSVTGQGAMFTLFSLLSLAQFMVQERREGRLARLLTMPTRPVNIVLGKILGVFFFGVLQFVVYIIVGVLLGIDWGDDYLAIAALVVTFCLAGTALGFMLSTFVSTIAQASTMVTLMGLTLAPLGGAWWPLGIVPEFMQVIGHISPIAWVMDGFQDVLYRNGTLADIALECAILLGYAAVFTVIGVMRFRYDS